MKLSGSQKTQLRSLIKAARKLAGKVDSPDDSKMAEWEDMAEKIVKTIFGNLIYSQLWNLAPNHGIFAIPPAPSYWIRYYKETLNQKASYLEKLIQSTDTENGTDIRLNRWPFHKEIEKMCIPTFENGHYVDAAERGFKVVKDRLRKLTGFENGSEAFGKGKLHIKGAPANVSFDLNEGTKFLCMAIDFFRNERVHDAYAKISEPKKALEYLAISSLAMRLLDNAEVKP